MTQSTHTPAPWYFDQNLNLYAKANMEDAEPRTPTADAFICSIKSRCKDAHLIAAAPELLEATQGLLLWLADETIKRRLEGLDDCQPVKHALKAIAKARGES